MSGSKYSGLSKCQIETNCILVEWEFKNLSETYTKIVRIAKAIPRTTEINQTNCYWHGICRSLIFRFPDDLEILQIPSKKIIQIKSASRYGMSDLGVNQRRIDSIYIKLIKKN